MAVEFFHLPPPPGFRGVNPDLPITRYYRHLPHWRQTGATYFVTFRLADALPQSQLNALQRCRELWEMSHPPPRSEADWEDYAYTYFKSIEGWMDEGYGECVFRDPQIGGILSDSLLYFQNERYFVSCFVVMPNHCHVVVRPQAGNDLEKILNSWKGYTASEINKRLSRHGPLWQNESYDRVVRDEEHLQRVIYYIGNNPKKAGIPEQAWLRWVDPEWESAGWGFRSES